jgi:hypothetical protein
MLHRASDLDRFFGITSSEENGSIRKAEHSARLGGGGGGEEKRIFGFGEKARRKEIARKN